jgi:GT2 family glycosyltransferase/glycosyltransferase involved in cell wall biosynthesis
VLATGQHALVSVVLVNYRGADDTIACLRAFDDVDWPADRLELIVVDNASGDGSVDRIRKAIPRARVIASRRNTGFAGGCNRGVDAAHGDYVAFVNNDARPDPGFVRAAVDVLERDLDVACVACRVLDWDGRLVDFDAPGLAWYGQAFKLNVGAEALESDAVERDVLFGTGSGLVVRRKVFVDVGGFDERYFMFFEDVDLGWRLWLLGHKVRFVSGSVIYHRHHASMSSIGVWREQFLLERNALFTLYKNYDDETLAATLPGALLLAMRRGVLLGEARSDELDLANGIEAGELGTATVSKTVLASAYALDAFGRALPELGVTRREIQSKRTRTDAEILRMFRTPFQLNVPIPELRETHEAILENFELAGRFEGRRRILVATGDAVTPRMAGPAIRAWHIAQALATEHDVKLVTTSVASAQHSDFEVLHVTEQEIAQLEKWCDIIIFQGFLLHENQFLYDSNKIVVADVYDPFHLEQLEQARDLGAEGRRDTVQSSTAVLNNQLARGDFLMCASPKQRDFWLGHLAALGRVNTETYDEDETLESLIAVVPFGVPEDPPEKTAAGMRGVIPGIGDEDEIILWGGGIYNWFDPLTLIRAVDEISRDRPQVRLVFMGMRHPNPNVPHMRMAVEALRLSDELGLTGRHVFFNEAWVPFDERQNFLLEADIGVSTHLHHVETAFSFRTRILDYIWASLPIVCTEGDLLAEIVETEDLGITVPPGDVGAVADAIRRLLSDADLQDACRANLRGVQERFHWSRVLEPVVEFCRAPRRAPDLLDADIVSRMNRPLRVVPPKWAGTRDDLRLVGKYFREGGVSHVASRSLQRARRVVRGKPRE